MDRTAKLERAWQLMLGARNDLVHAEQIVAQKREQFERANTTLRVLLDEHVHSISDEHIVARILEVA